MTKGTKEDVRLKLGIKELVGYTTFRKRVYDRMYSQENCYSIECSFNEGNREYINGIKL